MMRAEWFAAGFAAAWLLRFMLAIPGALREQRAMRAMIAQVMAEKQRAQPVPPATQPLRVVKPRTVAK